MAGSPCHDSASDVVDAFITAMREVFDPTSACPPDGGGSTAVRFFAGDGDLPASLMPNAGSGDCDPLLWVRVAHRFRSRTTEFPAAYVADTPCTDLTRVLAVEVGVGRCSTMEAEPDWDLLATEAEVSLDDSWRIEKVLCAVSARLRSKTRAVATDTVAPFGPSGGVIAWTGMAYVQF